MPISNPIGGLGFTMISCCLAVTVIGNAYYQKKQFYPSVVYITKSNPSMAAIYLMAFTIVILFGKLLKKIFFGTLRAAESENLIERFFYAVTETCLAFTVFRDDFSPKFVALFTVLLFLKAFHWLADYRVDYMERSPIITRLFHIRVASLLVLLSTIDILLVRYAYQSTMSLGASVQLVFGFEYAILLTVAYNIGVKYLCHGIDLQSENPWENKAMYLLYTELFVGFIKVLLYMAFLMIMVRIHTFPLFIIRPMYLTMKSFKKAFQDMLQSRRAIHNMNTLYPNATAEDLTHTDNVCIICREEMIVDTGVKKLPCNHLFHALCLRSWFQRQQTCPTCRLDVLRQTPARQVPPTPVQQQVPPTPVQQQVPPQVQVIQGRQPPQNVVEYVQQIMEQQDRARQQRNTNLQQPGAPQQQQQAPPPAAAGPFGGFLPPFPPFPVIPPQLLQQLQQQQQQHQRPSPATTSGTTTTTPAAAATSAATTTTAAAATTPTTSAVAGVGTTTAAGTTTTTTSTASAAATAPPIPPLPPMLGTIPGAPAFPFPSFPSMGLCTLLPPMPAPPTNYSALTTAELQAMEGRSRDSIVARLEALNNISTLVTAAAVQLTQYNQMMTRLDSEFPLQTPPPPSTTTTSSTTAAASSLSTNATYTTSTTTAAATNVSAASSSSSSASTGKGSVASGGNDAANTSVGSPAAAAASSSARGGDQSPAEEVRRRRLERFAVSSPRKTSDPAAAATTTTTTPTANEVDD